MCHIQAPETYLTLYFDTWNTVHISKMKMNFSLINLKNTFKFKYRTCIWFFGCFLDIPQELCGGLAQGPVGWGHPVRPSRSPQTAAGWSSLKQHKPYITVLHKQDTTPCHLQQDLQLAIQKSLIHISVEVGKCWNKHILAIKFNFYQRFTGMLREKLQRQLSALSLMFYVIFSQFMEHNKK